MDSEETDESLMELADSLSPIYLGGGGGDGGGERKFAGASPREGLVLMEVDSVRGKVHRWKRAEEARKLVAEGKGTIVKQKASPSDRIKSSPRFKPGGKTYANIPPTIWGNVAEQFLAPHLQSAFDAHLGKAPMEQLDDGSRYSIDFIHGKTAIEVKMWNSDAAVYKVRLRPEEIKRKIEFLNPKKRAEKHGKDDAPTRRTRGAALKGATCMVVYDLNKHVGRVFIRDGFGNFNVKNMTPIGTMRPPKSVQVAIEAYLASWRK